MAIHRDDGTYFNQTSSDPESYAADGLNLVRFWKDGKYFRQRLKGVTDASGGSEVALDASDFAGQTLEVSIDVAHPKTVTSGSLTVGFEYGNGSDYSAVLNANGITAGDWKSHTVEVTIDENATGDLYFRVQGPGSDKHIAFDNVSVAIPEPATLGLVAVCGGALLFMRRRLVM